MCYNHQQLNYDEEITFLPRPLISNSDRNHSQFLST